MRDDALRLSLMHCCDAAIAFAANRLHSAFSVRCDIRSYVRYRIVHQLFISQPSLSSVQLCSKYSSIAKLLDNSARIACILSDQPETTTAQSIPLPVASPLLLSLLLCLGRCSIAHYPYFTSHGFRCTNWSSRRDFRQQVLCTRRLLLCLFPVGINEQPRFHFGEVAHYSSHA